jgi:hypothetical protein
MNFVDWLMFELIVLTIFGAFVAYNRTHSKSLDQARVTAKIAPSRKD